MKRKELKKLITGMLVFILVLTCAPVNNLYYVVEAADSDTYNLNDKKSYTLDETYNFGNYIAPKKEGKYPVLFMVHGSNGMGGRETSFINDMNKWISLGYVDPVVIVFPHIKQLKEPNWGITDFGEYTSKGYLGTLLDYIKNGELSDKIDTDAPMSITGYSMGGATALHAGVVHSDTFINVGAASPSWCCYAGSEGWIKKAKDLAFAKSEDSHFMMGYGDGEGDWQVDAQGNKYWFNQFENNVKQYKDAINNNGMNTKDMFKIYTVSKSFGGHSWNVFHREMFYFLYYVKTNNIPTDDVIETACDNVKTAMYGKASISGVCKVGSVLTANISDSNVTSYAYKWRVGKIYVDGESGPTYTVRESDLGKKVSCEITDKTGKLSGVICATSSVIEKKIEEPKETGDTNNENDKQTDENVDKASSDNIDKIVEIIDTNDKKTNNDKKTDNSTKSNAKKRIKIKKGTILKSKILKYKITKVKYNKGKLVSGTVEVISVLNKKTKIIVVTDYVVLNGVKLKVTAIGKKAFKSNKKIKKVTIGKNIEKIGKYAFYGCKNLKSIKIKTVKLKKNSIGKNAFKKINKKARFKVPRKKFKLYKKLIKKAKASKKARIVK